MIIKKFSKFNESLIDQKLVKETSDRILKFLSDNGIFTWEKFYSSEFARNTINRIIDTSVKTMEEFNEVKFVMKLNLYNDNQLKNMLSRYEKIEDFEKCQIIKSKRDSKEFITNHY